ncbi:MAG TPA: GAD domain-containing protein, partial [Kofleriaceae bacterium]|nr:GAD domain-containing protein [Kofleriaceae bacterium]
ARSILRKSDFAPVAEALERGDMVAAVRLPRFRRLLGQRTQPGISFARELSERVRVIACLTARPFMLHSDVVDFGFKASRWNQLRAATRADRGDAVVVVWGPADDVDTAAREVIARAREALEGVPAETRQAHADGTTGFERILPGPDRMYPDTDTPPLPIPDAWVAELRLAERPWQRSARYRDLGLPPPAAERLAAAPWADLFDAVAPPAGAVARRLAAALDKRLPGLDQPPAVDRLAELCAALAARPLLAAVFEELLVAAATEPARSVTELLASYPPASDAEVARAVDACDAERAKLRSADPDAALRWAMGRVMPALRGRVDPAALRARLAPLLEAAA